MIPVFSVRGVYYQTCDRCAGGPVVKGLPVRRPIIWSLDLLGRSDEHPDIERYTGGVITLFSEDGERYNAACSCEIGKSRGRWVKPYDQFPGTTASDTNTWNIYNWYYRRLNDETKAMIPEREIALYKQKVPLIVNGSIREPKVREFAMDKFNIIIEEEAEEGTFGRELWERVDEITSLLIYRSFVDQFPQHADEMERMLSHRFPYPALKEAGFHYG